MHSWHEFWTMGGYARYVWPAYGVVLVVFVASAWSARRGFRLALKRADRRAHEERK
ncbi:MAG: heme exporter protein CcmD [Gammaproteobacteria bacterium]